MTHPVRSKAQRRGITLQGPVGFWCELQADGSLKQVDSPFVATTLAHFEALSELQNAVEVVLDRPSVFQPHDETEHDDFDAGKESEREQIQEILRPAFDAVKGKQGEP